LTIFQKASRVGTRSRWALATPGGILQVITVGIPGWRVWVALRGISLAKAMACYAVAPPSRTRPVFGSPTTARARIHDFAFGEIACATVLSLATPAAMHRALERTVRREGQGYIHPVNLKYLFDHFLPDPAFSNGALGILAGKAWYALTRDT